MTFRNTKTWLVLVCIVVGATTCEAACPATDYTISRNGTTLLTISSTTYTLNVTGSLLAQNRDVLNELTSLTNTLLSIVSNNTAWTPFDYRDGITYQGNCGNGAGIRRLNNMYHLKGCVVTTTATANGAVIFRVPSGFAPPIEYGAVMASTQNAQIVYLAFEPDGTVQAWGGGLSAGWIVELNGVSFIDPALLWCVRAACVHLPRDLH